MIAIIDYGAGNLGSIEKAFKFLGLDAVLTSDKDIILSADAVVLPGVGAFADAMESLKKFRLDKIILDVVDNNKPFLGICLGMQLMFEYSEEGGGKIPGLGFLKGAIKRFPANLCLKIPHMGWNCLNLRPQCGTLRATSPTKETIKKEECALFKNFDHDVYVYFVHSYYLDATDKSIVSATAGYGIEFDAVVNYKNIFLTQFHPEKSGENGLKILRNFADII